MLYFVDVSYVYNYLKLTFEFLCNSGRWTHLQKLTIIGSWFTHVFISSHQFNFLQVYAVVIWFKDFLKLNSNKNLKMCQKFIQPSFLGMCKCHVCGMRSSHCKEIIIQLDPRIWICFLSRSFILRYICIRITTITRWSEKILNVLSKSV